jgi:hypothetical protein
MIRECYHNLCVQLELHLVLGETHIKELAAIKKLLVLKNLSLSNGVRD